MLLVSVESLECEYYNRTECTEKSNWNGEFCSESVRTVPCGEDNSSKTVGCYAVWQRGKNSSTEILQYKGCFQNDKQCVGQQSCVEKNHPMSNDRNALTYYCCCATDNCNQDYSFDPLPTTTTPKRESLVMPIISIFESKNLHFWNLYF